LFPGVFFISEVRESAGPGVNGNELGTRWPPEVIADLSTSGLDGSRHSTLSCCRDHHFAPLLLLRLLLLRLPRGGPWLETYARV